MTGGETIVAVASPPGRAPRGIVRIAGPHSLVALRAIGARPDPQTLAGRAVYTLRLPLAPGAPPLPCLALVFRAPHSYTGDDAVDLILPGAPALLDAVVARLAAVEGVRPAGPGEFTMRALLAGRLTPEQAEGVAMTIAAENERDLRAAARLRNGEAGRAYLDLADHLADTLALVEAGIDFTDQEDVRPIGPADLRTRLDAMLGRLEAWLADAAAREATDESPVVVLAGPPNAGKSTLFNALLGRTRAVVSDTPGATRDALREPLDLTADAPAAAFASAPGVVTLVDLAGLDEALTQRSAVDAAAQRRAVEAVESADVVLLCDPRARFDLPLPDSGATVLRVRTKADLPGVEAPGEESLSVCALDRWNLPALRRAIADAAFGARANEGGGLPARHRQALERARAALARAEEVAPDPGAPEELVAAALREALDAIGEIAGRASPDDVIGRIFATFCVGK